MAAEERLWRRRIVRLSDHLLVDKTQSDLQLAACRAQKAQQPDAKVATADAAVALIQPGATICVSGFVGLGVPEHLLNALRRAHDERGQPAGLTLINVAVGGTAQGRGLNVLAKDGLVTRYVFAWSGLSPGFHKLAQARRLEAWNLPLGVVSHMIRDVAAQRIGPITKTGLRTYVDPREQGGKFHADQAAMVHLVTIGGQELLWYEAPKRIDVALLRGTSADADGNIAFEHEAAYSDALNQAMAAHNSGGIVIVQVARLVERGSLPFRAVHIPGSIVTKVVVAPAEEHWQSMASPTVDGSLCGEYRHPAGSLPPLPLSMRRIIAYRAMLAIERPQAIINLGVGMPEGVASVVASSAARDVPHLLPLTLTTEVGLWGGTPAGGLRFGAAVNGTCAVPCATQIDFYSGRGIDQCFLGMAEADVEGNVNVSRFADRAPGCGGFIDISQTSKAVVFVGTFTSGGLKVAVKDGKLQILQEGRTRKFVQKVHEKTFSGATVGDRTVLFVTERAVFRAHDKGLHLLEIAPGVSLEKDVLGQMDFRPHMDQVGLMDARCFHL